MTGWDPPRRYGFEQVPGNFTDRLRVSSSIEETAGGCRLALDQEMTLRRSKLLLWVVVRRYQEAEMAACLSRLKRAAEVTEGAGASAP